MKKTHKFIYFLISTVMCILAIELSWMVGIWLYPNTFLKPELYANHICEDTYWYFYRMKEQGSIIDPMPKNKTWENISADAVPPNNFIQDTELGYTHMRKPIINPFGFIRPDKPFVVKNKKILLFGDSMLAGMEVKVGQSITSYLNKNLKEYESLNFGIPGYGLGQIYLRTLRVSKKMPNYPVILLIFDENVDRMFLSYRGSPKPRFFINSQGLVRWEYPKGVEEHRKKMPLLYSLRAFHHYFSPTRHPCNHKAKQAVEFIIQQLKEKLGQQLLGVATLTLGLPKNTEYVLHACRKFKVPSVDLKKIILDTIDDPASCFTKTNHPNHKGNKVIAEILFTTFIKDNPLIVENRDNVKGLGK